MQITICGGGNAAHVLAGLLAARQDLSVNVYTSYNDEALQWRQAIAAQGGTVVITPGDSLLGRPRRISEDPDSVVPGSRLVLLALPAFAHQVILQAIAPYLDDDAWVGALSARGGFDWGVRDILDDKGSSVTVFGLQTLPWACRIQHYGREAAILGTKAEVDLASWPPHRAEEVAALLSDLLNVRMCPIGNFLSLTLANTGQLIHPTLMFGLFHDWDGSPYAEAPFFYKGLSAATADLLQQLSDEVQSLRTALEERFPGLDLSAVRPLYEWVLRSYGHSIADDSSLRSSFATNRGYAALRAPMRSGDNGLLPDFQHRYLAEDVPFGLVVTRGIAELAGVETPTMDRIITWAQARLSKAYLVGGKLAGHDVVDSRAPQCYGFKTVDHIVRY